MRLPGDPRAPEALIAYNVHVSKLISLIWTHLAPGQQQGEPLGWLAEPGTNVWLIPHKLAIQEWAKEGAGTADDVNSRMFPLGEVIESVLSIQHALRHIRHPAARISLPSPTGDQKAPVRQRPDPCSRSSSSPRSS